MKRNTIICILITFLVVALRRAPAPIVEPAETATPAASPTRVPEQPAKPKRAKSHATSPPNSGKILAAKAVVKSSPPSHSKFAGTWVGVMPGTFWGDISETFTVNEQLTEVTLVTSRHEFLKAVHLRIEGDKLIADFGGLYGIYTIMPSADGITASVRLQALMTDQTATYRRK